MSVARAMRKEKNIYIHTHTHIHTHTYIQKAEYYSAFREGKKGVITIFDNMDGHGI